MFQLYDMISREFIEQLNLNYFVLKFLINNYLIMQHVILYTVFNINQNMATGFPVLE